jgi:hypothetical protein
VKSTPVLAIVGDKDPGWRMWQKEEPSWRAAGIPLTLRSAPGKGHAWLFDSEQTRTLTEWLGTLANPPAATGSKAK